MRRTLYQLPTTIFLILLTPLAVAANTQALYNFLVAPLPGYSSVVTLSGGPLWQHAGKTQTLVLASEIEKTYKASQDFHDLGIGEVFVGVQHALPVSLDGQLGLIYAFTGDARPSGHIWDDADPNFDNYRYEYKIKHSHVALQGKVSTHWCLPLQPWLSASVGVGFNRAIGFTNHPFIFAALPNPDFSDHTTTAFTYSVGVGVQRILAKNWQVGIGYEFSDWGKSKLGRAHSQTTESRLALSHLYTHGLMLNLTFAPSLT